MQVTEIALTVAFVIILFEVLPEKSVWSVPVRQADVLGFIGEIYKF